MGEFIVLDKENKPIQQKSSYIINGIKHNFNETMSFYYKEKKEEN